MKLMNKNVPMESFLFSQKAKQLKSLSINDDFNLFPLMNFEHYSG